MAGHLEVGRTSFLKDAYLSETLEFIYIKPWKEKTFLIEEYVNKGRSIAEIARQTLSSRAAIRDALIEFDIKRRQRGNPRKRRSQLPYGYRIIKGQMLQHEGEQLIISVIQKMASKGNTLREISDYLSTMKVPTKRRGVRWHPEMVRRILSKLK